VIMPQYALERLYALTRGHDVYITTEVGQHQMWAAQFFKFEEPNRWMTSGGLGTMGYGLPASDGLQVAPPDPLGTEFAGRHMLYEKFYAGNSLIVRNQNDREAPWERFHDTVDGLLARIAVERGGQD